MLNLTFLLGASVWGALIMSSAVFVLITVTAFLLSKFLSLSNGSMRCFSSQLNVPHHHALRACSVLTFTHLLSVPYHKTVRSGVRGSPYRCSHNIGGKGYCIHFSE